MDRTGKSLRKLIDSCGQLAEDQGRIARRNARRRVLGAVRSLCLSLDRDYPSVPKPSKVKSDGVQTSVMLQGGECHDRVDDAANKLRWRKFEYQVIHVRKAWDGNLVCEFNRYFCGRISAPEKPIVFDIRANSSLLGQHTHDRIRISHRLDDRGRWRTLFHEMAHYRVRNHRRQFVLEMAFVYKAWKQFMRSREETAGYVAEPVLQHSVEGARCAI